MLREPLSDKDIQDNFNRLMDEALSIGASGIRSDTGLDIETMQAIDHVAQAYPKPNLVLIQNAKKEFAKQLDGTHMRERARAFDAEVESFYPSK